MGTTESPTTDMYGDCQELLQLFGLPYIIAPAEAEAQCAWLDAQGLVDGVVTDDNDAFLFGAKHIYRYSAFPHGMLNQLYSILKLLRQLPGVHVAQSL